MPRMTRAKGSGRTRCRQSAYLFSGVGEMSSQVVFGGSQTLGDQKALDRLRTMSMSSVEGSRGNLLIYGHHHVVLGRAVYDRRQIKRGASSRTPHPTLFAISSNFQQFRISHLFISRLRSLLHYQRKTGAATAGYVESCNITVIETVT